MSAELDVYSGSNMSPAIGLSETYSEFQLPDGIPNLQPSTRMQHFETLLQLLAENCYLKLTHSKRRQEQQAIIANYAVHFAQLNDDPNRRARAYLEAEVEKHGVSKRTLLRMLPVELKDYSKMMNRLGKGMMTKHEETSQSASEDEVTGCYVEPD